jgi:hypothetical protein
MQRIVFISSCFTELWEENRDMSIQSLNTGGDTIDYVEDPNKTIDHPNGDKAMMLKNMTPEEVEAQRVRYGYPVGTSVLIVRARIAKDLGIAAEV